MKKVWYVFPEGMTAKKAVRAYCEAAEITPSVMQRELLKKTIEVSMEMAVPLDVAQFLRRKFGGDIFPYEGVKRR